MSEISEIQELFLKLNQNPNYVNPTDEISLLNIPSKIVREYQIMAINSLISKARSTRFWFDKLKIVSEIRYLEDLDNIPITSRDEFHSIFTKKKWDDCLTPTDDTQIIYTTTSGSSTKPPFISAMTFAEFQVIARELVRGLLLNKIQSDQVFFIALPGFTPSTFLEKQLEFMNIITNPCEPKPLQHIIGPLFKGACKILNIDSITVNISLPAFKNSPIAAVFESEQFIERLISSNTNVLVTSPNMLLNGIIPFLCSKKLSFSQIGISIVILTGQYIDLQLETEIRSQGCQIISIIESGEAGLLGFSAPIEINGNRFVGYVPNNRTCLLQVVDDCGRTKSIGEWGKLVITRLTTWHQPLIRYDHENICRFIEYDGKIFLDKDIRRVKESNEM